MGDAYPELRRQPRRDRERRAQRGGSVRRRADRRTARVSRRPWIAPPRPAPPCPVTRRSGSTTRSGVPLDFMEDLAGQRQIAIDREGFERAMEGQRVKARAGSTFKGGDRSLSLSMTPGARADARGDGRRFRRLRGDAASRVRRSWRSSTASGAEVESLPSGASRLRRARRGRRSTSRRAVRSPTPAGWSAPTAEARRRAHDPPAGTAAAAPDPGRARRAPRRSKSLPPRSPTRCATRPGAITRPRTCCTRRCARCSARTSSRPARWSRPSGCASTSSTSPR